jgi:hypothetical protein
MPRDKDRKRIIRSRMTKTGESYTKLRDRAASDRAKRYWTDRLDALASLFTADVTQ